MMSIPTATTATPSNPGAEPGGSVATAPVAADAAGGFMALIGSLLQGAAPPMVGASLPESGGAPESTALLSQGGALPAVAATAGPAADAVTPDLLASLGLPPPATATATAAAPATLPAEPATSADTDGEALAREAADVARETSGSEAQDAAAAFAAAAAVLAATAAVAAVPVKLPFTATEGAGSSAGSSAVTATPLSAAPAVLPAPANANAPATPAEAPASATPSLSEAFAALVEGQDDPAAEPDLVPEEGGMSSVSSAGGTSASGGQGTNGLHTLNAWAAAAHRIATAQDVAPRAALASPDAQLREFVGTPRWKDELGARITLMATQGQQSGSLRLSPEHLGPLEIQITVADDRTTNVQFGAQHAETRTALQEALPRLREMFASAGLQLGDAGVSGQAPRDRPTSDAGFTASGYESRSDGEPTPVQRPVRSVTHSGLLDTYA